MKLSSEDKQQESAPNILQFSCLWALPAFCPQFLNKCCIAQSKQLCVGKSQNQNYRVVLVGKSQTNKNGQFNTQLTCL